MAGATESGSMETDDVYTFRDVKPTPDVVHKYDRSTLKNVPIVIDHGKLSSNLVCRILKIHFFISSFCLGSYQCRVGWAVEPDDPKLVFRNLMAKLRKEKGKSVILSSFTLYSVKQCGLFYLCCIATRS